MDYIDYAGSLRDKFGKSLKSKGYAIYGSGGGFRGQVNNLDLMLKSYKRLKIDEARQEYLKIMNQFLYTLNMDKYIRPYFKDYPVTPKNILLQLSFSSPDNVRYNKPNITLIFNNENKIVYCVYESELKRFSKVFEETYEEALKEVGKDAAESGE